MKAPTFQQVRSSVLLVLGIAGIVYETLVSTEVRPTLLVLFSGMVGLPLFMRQDTRAAVEPAPTPPPKPAPEAKP